MPALLAVILILVVSLPATASRQPKPVTPSQQFKALLKEYNAAAGGVRKAKTDRQRKAHVDNLGKYPRRFLDLAEKHPKDPAALRAIRQAIQAIGSTDSAAQIASETNRAEFPKGLHDGSPARIVKLLRRDHLRSDKLGPIIDRMRYGYRLEFEPFLSSLVKSSPHRTVRALAGLALAQFLNDRRRMRLLVDDRPELKRRYAVLFGKDYLPKLKPRAGVKRIEALFEQLTKFDDVDGPLGETVAERAKSELYELRVLSVGKSAPDIVGKDQDGASFKLSDYRGKVVLLYFWMEY